MAAMGRDPKLGPKHVEGARNFVTKIWNATRFAEMNGPGEARDQAAWENALAALDS